MPKQKKRPAKVRKPQRLEGGLFDPYPYEAAEFESRERRANEQSDEDDLWPGAEICPVCRGSGWLVLPDEHDESECEACGGTGYVLTLI